MILAPLSLILAMNAEYGKAEICRFAGGAKAAVSMEFDDSMNTQLENAIPLLDARKLRATFFVNPGRDSHKQHRQQWEVALPKAGHELGNHTMTHVGAEDEEQLEAEVKACSEALANVYGSKPKLIPFAQPGGVPWDVTPEQEKQVFERYLLIPTKNRRFYEEEPVNLAKEALEKGSWVQAGFHGIGGEWLSTGIPALTRLLDFLVQNKATIWTAPTMEVTKYIMERDAVNRTTISFPGSDWFTADLAFDVGKLPSYGLEPSQLYDQPLTVAVEVPDHWTTCKAEQSKKPTPARVELRDGVKKAIFSLTPFAGPVRVSKTNN